MLQGNCTLSRCHVTLPLCTSASVLLLAPRSLLVFSGCIPSRRLFPEAVSLVSRLRFGTALGNTAVSPTLLLLWRAHRLHSAQPLLVLGSHLGCGDLRRGRGRAEVYTLASLPLASPLHVCRVCLQHPAQVAQQSTGVLPCTHEHCCGGILRHCSPGGGSEPREGSGREGAAVYTRPGPSLPGPLHEAPPTFTPGTLCAGMSPSALASAQEPSSLLLVPAQPVLVLMSRTGALDVGRGQPPCWREP